MEERPPSENVTSPSYSGEEDYRQMRDLVARVYALRGPPVYCTVGDLDWWRATAEAHNSVWHVRLWSDDESRLIGFIWPSADELDMVSHPQHRALESEMLAWAEAHRPDAQADELKVWAYSGDEPRIDVLRRRGYQPTEEALRFLARTLSEEIPPPDLPPGYYLRQSSAQGDGQQWVRVHRQAFPGWGMTHAKYRAVSRMPAYRPELDLVVEASNGTLAAICLAWLDEANRSGLFEPVGTHPAHRRRGLARALLREGMRRLRRLGAREALVCAYEQDQPSARLYHSLGFREMDRAQLWRKAL